MTRKGGDTLSSIQHSSTVGSLSTSTRLLLRDPSFVPDCPRRTPLLFDEWSGSDYIRFFPGGGEVIRLLLGAPGGREGTPVSRKGANYLKKLTENTNLYRLTA